MATLTSNAAPRTGYAPVNGLQMYYQIHGSGDTPLVLLHGAYMSIDTNFGASLPTLSSARQVIAVETQGHGRTADIDRPIMYETMADDVAALLEHLGVEQADIFGYSMGVATALQVAIRPSGTRKGAQAGRHLGVLHQRRHLPRSPRGQRGDHDGGVRRDPFEAEYLRLAPRPADWPVLIETMKVLDGTVQAWPAADLQGIQAPALVIVGDSDIIRPEHAVEMFRLLGGGVPGDLDGLPKSRLAIIPGTTHLTVMM